MFGFLKKKLQEGIEKLAAVVKAPEELKKEAPQPEPVKEEPKVEEVTIEELPKKPEISEAEPEIEEIQPVEEEKPIEVEVIHKEPIEIKVPQVEEKNIEPIISRVERFVRSKLPEDFIENHVKIVVNEAVKLCEHYPDADREVVEIAAWLHDVIHPLAGYQGEDHHIQSKMAAKEFLEAEGYDKRKMEQVLHCIEAHRTTALPDPQTIEAKIVSSADKLTHFIKFDRMSENMGFEAAYKKIERDLKLDFLVPEAIERAKDLMKNVKRPEAVVVEEKLPIEEKKSAEQIETPKELENIAEKISEVAKKVEHIKEPETEEPKVEEPKKKGLLSRLLKRKPKEEDKEEIKKTEEKGFLEKIAKKVTEKKITENEIKDILWDLQISLMESDVAVEVSEKICNDIKKALIDKSVKRGSDIEKIVKETMKNSITEILSVEEIDLLEKIRKKKPFLIVFLGFNGSGKTTSIARLGYLLKKSGLSVVFAAADSWRAAAIEQLEEHGKNLGIKVIKHAYGADPAAVIFDAKKYAESHGIDVILADTAGRSHANENLMDELKKIIRVNKPDMKILVVDALTGNDVVEQTEYFNKAAGVDGMIMTKVDVYDKGGALLSAVHKINKPILYVGIGQGYENLKKFNVNEIVQNMLG